MATDTELVALVALLRHGKRASNAYADEIEELGSAVVVAEQELGLLAAELFAAAAAEVAGWTKQGLQMLTIRDNAYPENLRAVYDRPPLIFVSGRLLPRDARSVAIIGSRRATDTGLDAARGLSAHLSERGFTIVSGLARGIDTAAHTGALDQGGRTVAVIGTGLHHAYPPENAALQRRIATGGAVLSQFWPDSHPSRQSFLRRNALMSGLALANLIVEASHRSGARAQARMALDHGRPVLLMAGLLAQDWARELSSRPGTYVVRSPDEVVEVVERLSSTDSLIA